MVILKKYLVWAWMVALFTATVGVSVQQIYCYCLHKTTISWFAEVDACRVKETAKPSSTAACCRKERSACCKKSNLPEHSEKPCTKKTTRVFQLKTEFILEKQVEKPENLPFEDLEIVEFSRFLNSNIAARTETYQTPPKPPPPLSGRSICLRHQHFRC